ncbi:cobalt transporter CbiM [Phorcysia thermohydrogeniphila]|uniref:Cobalt/nickel transport system permease protein n=1 Tax=Phorcysia thermohydrogeniphila TaxID=936138 RepID=A0A4R1GDJ4_9BACT|nr:cobalt transporter CbiM [Phorcysia thermohydrogeniphila]TCK04665.1 cobalt/nickel transport system permease protein [Phorcysia thermohydrogeniphila]
MHISEGVLPGSLLVAGWALTIAGTYVGLKKLDNDRIPLAALLAATFFVASLIHVPAGPTSVHLVLNGLAGILLGWTVFPVLLVGLFLQAVLFQFGGLTVLGVNTFNMAFPALVAYYLCKGLLSSERKMALIVAGALSSFVAIMGSGLLVALELVFTGEAFRKTAELALLAHLPVAVVEAFVNAFILLFLKRAVPEILRRMR